jgi:hypothetical protein
MRPRAGDASADLSATGGTSSAVVRVVRGGQTVTVVNGQITGVE